ncbi:hypothetical protein MASR2M15_07050 [Anaerolineales bacterium]
METIWNLPLIESMELTQVRETRPAAVLSGHNSWAAVSSLLDLPIVAQAEPYSADIQYLNDLASGLPEQTEVVYGIGGGLVCDAAKYIAYVNHLPCILIPTALSVDGFFTALVAVRKSGTVSYVTTGPAEKVIIDFDIVSTAPKNIRGAGIVEILSMTTGLLDWQYAAKANKNTAQTRFQGWAAQVAASIAQQAYKIAAGVGEGRKDALRNLLDLICLEVQLTNQLGHNRPQEGSEQYFAYAIEPRIARDSGIPYADLVGPGILIAATLHNQNVNSIKTTLESAGVRLDQLKKDDIVYTIKTLPDYVRSHELPYSIVHDQEFSYDAALDIVKRAGLDNQ